MREQVQKGLVFSDCARCGLSFEIGAAEQGWYAARKLPLPHSCASCRLSSRTAVKKPQVLSSPPEPGESHTAGVSALGTGQS
jgi:hypothetical protein